MRKEEKKEGERRRREKNAKNKVKSKENRWFLVIFGGRVFKKALVIKKAPPKGVRNLLGGGGFLNKNSPDSKSAASWEGSWGTQ